MGQVSTRTTDEFFGSTTPVLLAQGDFWSTGISGVSSDGLQLAGVIYFGVGEHVETLHQRHGEPGPVPVYSLPEDITAPVGLLAAAWGGIAVAAGSIVCLLTPGQPLVQKIYAAGAPVKWMRMWASYLIVCSSRSIVLIDRSGGVFYTVPLSSKNDLIGGQPLLIGSRLYYLEELPDRSASTLRSVRLDLQELEASVAHWAGHSDNPISTDGASLYVSATTGAQNSLQAYNTLTKRPLWQEPITLDAAVATNVVRFGQNLYFCAGETLMTVRQSDGGSVDHEDLSQRVTGALRLIDGVVYGVGTSRVFAFNPLDGNLIYADLGASPHWLGNSEETLYLSGGDTARAMNLAAVTRSYDVDIELMQDFIQGTATAPVRVPRYQVTMNLFDLNKVPRPREQVHLWAAAPSTHIKINGATSTAGPTAPLLVETDFSGALRLELEATGLSAPTLTLWCPFMPPDERIVVCPDYSTHTKLSTISGDELKAAKDYGGNLILLPRYAASAQDLATAINNSMSLVKGNRKRRARAVAYISARSADRGVFTISTSGGDSMKRDAPAVADIAMPLQTDLNWSLDLHVGSENGGASYSEMSDAAVQQWKEDHPEYTQPGQKRSLTDYWEAMKSETATLTSVVIHAADAVTRTAIAEVNLIIGEAEETVSLVIDTVEHAAVLVQSIFKTIATGVDKVVQALSYVFDWEHVRSVNRALKEKVVAGMTALAGAGLLDPAQAFVDQHIDELKEGVDAGFDSLRTLVGASSFNSFSFAGAPSTKRSTPQPLLSGVKQTWMFNKIHDALMSGSAPDGAGGLGLVIPSFTLSSGVESALEALIEQMSTSLSSSLSETLARDAVALSSISASQFLSGSIAAFLTLVEGMIDVIIDGMGALVDGMFAAVRLVVPQILELVRASISIPMIGDVLGPDLCLLDVMTLPMAVPMTLLEGLSQRRNEGAEVGVALTSAGAATAFGAWSFWDSSVQISEESSETPPDPERRNTWNKRRAIVSIVGRIVVCGLVIGEFVAVENEDHVVDFVLAVPMVVLACVDVYFLWTRDKPARDDFVGRMIQGAFGGIGMLLLGILGLTGDFDAEPPAWTKRVWRVAAFGSEYLLALIDMVVELLNVDDAASEELRRTREGYVAICQLVIHGAACATLFAVGGVELNAALQGRGQQDLPAIELMRAPEAAPKFTPAGSGPYRAEDLRYAVSFFDEAAETPLGRWSNQHNLGHSTATTVWDLPVDPSGLARGRRIYRQMGTQGVRLVGQVDDNEPGSTFTDDLLGS